MAPRPHTLHPHHSWPHPLWPHFEPSEAFASVAALVAAAALLVGVAVAVSRLAPWG